MEDRVAWKKVGRDTHLSGKRQALFHRVYKLTLYTLTPEKSLISIITADIFITMTILALLER